MNNPNTKYYFNDLKMLGSPAPILYIILNLRSYSIWGHIRAHRTSTAISSESKPLLNTCYPEELTKLTFINKCHTSLCMGLFPRAKISSLCLKNKSKSPIVKIIHTHIKKKNLVRTQESKARKSALCSPLKNNHCFVYILMYY